jgi:hypothetical protein
MRLCSPRYCAGRLFLGVEVPEVSPLATCIAVGHPTAAAVQGDPLVGRALSTSWPIRIGNLVRRQWRQGLVRVGQVLPAVVCGNARRKQLGVVGAEVDSLALQKPLCDPPACLPVQIHAPISRGCPSPPGEVLLLLSLRNDAKVRPPVVTPVAVDVIDVQAIPRRETEQLPVHVDPAPVSGPANVTLLSQKPSMPTESRMVGGVDQGPPDDLALAVIERDAT